MIDFKFPSCGIRAKAIDRRMRCSLAESLDYIATQINGQIDFDTKAMTQLITGLNQGDKFPPSTFAIYTELVLALDSDNIDSATQLLKELVQERPQDKNWQLLALDDAKLTAHVARYINLMDADPLARFEIFSPTPKTASCFRERLERSYRLLSAAIPELAAEFDALVSQIIMVEGDSTAEYQFDGGSSYMLWGGLFLNASSHENEVALIEVMAHESAHILLFGFASDEALVNNDDDTLYQSPLRVDSRPMDGIYHATYVSARMHWAMSKLLASGVLNDSDHLYAESAMLRDQKNFEAGYSVVKQYGDLTPTGLSVMKSAREYMDSI
jgi:HEXXH motif-containing protein